jgi:hypothetical protein
MYLVKRAVLPVLGKSSDWRASRSYTCAFQISAGGTAQLHKISTVLTSVLLLGTIPYY